MAKPVTIVITSDRYGDDPAGLPLEHELAQAFPELDMTLRGAPGATEDDLIAVARDADALLVSTRDRFTPRVLANIPRVKVIGQYGAGLDNIDLDAATEAGIVVTHYPGYCTAEVADHAMALILAVNRRILELDHDVRAGAWQRHGADLDSILRGPIPSLSQSTLGIVGFGRIGQAVARRAHVFGMNLLVADPYVDPGIPGAMSATPLSLDDLIPQADILTLHCSLTAETHGLIGAEELALMKPTASIINTSRGPVVDLEALANHLAENPHARAAVDVVDPEPLPGDHPLGSLPNVIHTPHAAYYSEQSVITVRTETFNAAVAVLMGMEPHTVANPAVLSTVSLQPSPG